MSLEELRNDWDSIEESIDGKTISRKQVKAVLGAKYRSSFSGVLIFETILLFTYLYFIALTIFQFDKLKTGYLEILGIVSILILTFLAVVRILKMIKTFRNRDLNHSHLMALKKLAKQNVDTQKYYLLHLISGFVLVVILVVLSIKIYNEYDLIQSKYFWMIIIPSSFLFTMVINRWIKKSYMKVVRETETLLQELK